MARYQEMMRGIRARARLQDVDEARLASEHVVAVLAHHLEAADRERLSTILPSTLRDAMDVGGPGSAANSTIVQDVARRGDYPAEQARYLIEAVLGELGNVDESGDEDGNAKVVDTLRQHTPELGSLVPTTDESTESGWRADTAHDHPNRLTSDEVTAVLRELTGWTGSTRRIWRTIELPEDRMEPLLNRIKQAERDLNHPASIERSDSQLLVTVWTRSLNAVTDLDTALARRIDEAVATVGSSG